MTAWQNKNVTVMGLGHHQGGMAVLNYLCQQGARVTLTEMGEQSLFQDQLSQLQQLPLISAHFGGHQTSHFEGADCVVISPAVSPANRWRVYCAEHAIDVSSEIELFWQAFPGRTICVTGTVGKSTVVTLIHRILKAAGMPVLLGGNIGHSLLPELPRCTHETLAVLELSSFQAWQLAALKPQPEITVITNLSENHLDWHSDLDDYRAAKLQLTQFQTSAQVLITDADEPLLQKISTDAARIWLSTTLAIEEHGLEWSTNAVHLHWKTSTDKFYFPLPEALQGIGRAQRQDAGLILCVTQSLGIPIDLALSTIASFEGLPHRCQIVGDVNGRLFVDDSKSTTAAATLAAIDRFKNAPLILLMGGRDKGVDLTTLIHQASQSCQDVIVYGECVGHLTLKSLQSFVPDSCRVSFCEQLSEAVAMAYAASTAGTTILLSPACSSFDQFRSFEHRGEVFQKLVDQLQRSSSQR